MQIAKTIQAIDTGANVLVNRIMDRSEPLSRDLISAVLSQPQFSWHGRKPKPAVDSKGAKRPTNLDLLSWLIDLYRRGARIELPQYNNRTPWKATTNEQHVGGTKRHGVITGLVSHHQHLSFSVQIADMSVLCHQQGVVSQGAERSYMLADYNGDWHAGWHGFDWDKTKEELAYLQRRKLLVDGRVDFADYLHLNRRQSIYSAPYLLVKLVLQRIEDQLAFYRAELKRLEEAGINPVPDVQESKRQVLAVGPSTSAEVPVFEMQVRGLEFVGAYSVQPQEKAGYYDSVSILKAELEQVRTIVQFVARAAEVAFYRFGLEQGFVSSWVKGTSWKVGQAGWNTMQLGNNLTLAHKATLTEKRVAA